MTEDERLIFLINNFGSEKAKDRLIRKYYDSIYAYAYRRTLNVEDALDLTQEIFIKALTALHTFDRSRASFKTWLYAIAERRIIDFCRSFRFTSELDCGLPDGGRFEEIAENRSLAAAVMDFLAREDESGRQVVELKIFGGLTFDEIGGMLGISPNTAKTAYYRAIKKCGKEFGNNEDRIPLE